MGRHNHGTRIGIIGGTFDPIHWAHLVVAEESRVRLGLSKVIFVPAGRPAHKKDHPTSDAEHRYAMVLLGTYSNPDFQISRLEIERAGPSYSVDTIREFKRMYGSNTEIYFIAGADEILDIQSWHEAEALPELARFAAVPRPGFDLAELERRLPGRFLASIELLPIREIDISATEVRGRVAAGKSIKYLVPESVESYIYKHGLYSPEKTA